MPQMNDNRFAIETMVNVHSQLCIDSGANPAFASRTAIAYASLFYPEISNMPYIIDSNGDVVWESTTEAIRRAARQASRQALVSVTDEVPARPTAACDCKGCKLAKGEPCQVLPGMLRSYSYEPRPWRFYETKAQQTGLEASPYYLGVELETDTFRISTDKRNVRSNVDSRTAIGLRQPKQLWIAKRDGSVSGPEFVSHPATMEYWNSKQDKIGEMFTDLLHAGYRSYDTDRCGMHINISKTAFSDDINHLFRFLSLIYGNPQMSMRLSQRTRSSAQKWATVSEFDNAGYTMRDVARSVINGMPLASSTSRWYQSRPRSTALNAERGSRRLEFRLPRGTLRVERFYKNLEWVVAMVDYSREGQPIDMKAKKFLGYVAERSQQYPNLSTFMKERTKIALSDS